jgi:predicted CopG family antitoxin
MLGDAPIVWRTVKVSDDAYKRIQQSRQANDSMNDPIERAFGVPRGDRVRKIAANMAAKVARKNKNTNKKTKGKTNK